MSSHTITVALANDDNIFKKGLKVSVEKFPRITIIGEATNTRELVKFLSHNHPDVILLDLQMNGGGLGVIKKIFAQKPGANIIILSSVLEEHLILQIIEAGISGFLLKT